MLKPLTPIRPPRASAVRAVAKAARDRMARVEGPPCEDLEGCLRVVYLAGVADALGWVIGDGPPPTEYGEPAA